MNIKNILNCIEKNNWEESLSKVPLPLTPNTENIQKELLIMITYCPELWDIWLKSRSTGCPSDYGLVDNGLCENTNNCRKCWEKALAKIDRSFLKNIGSE